MDDCSEGCSVCGWYSKSHKTSPHTRVAKSGKGSRLGCGTTPFSTASRDKANRIRDSRYMLIWNHGRPVEVMRDVSKSRKISDCGSDKTQMMQMWFLFFALVWPQSSDFKGRVFFSPLFYLNIPVKRSIDKIWGVWLGFSFIVGSSVTSCSLF